MQQYTSRCRQNHRPLASCLVFIYFVVLLGTITCQGQSTTTTTSKAPPSEENLERLSNEELESICTTRGFELVREEENGKAFEYTHDDFVEAARRCLQVEREMNEILEQNPQLAVELEDEIKRMEAAKKRLEKEQQDIIAEKEELEGRLTEATETDAVETESNATQAPRAFGLGSSKAEGDQKRNDTIEDLGVIDLDATEENVTSTKEAIKDETPVTAATTSSSASNQTTAKPDVATETPSTAVAQKESEVLTVKEVLREIFGELFQKVEEDVKRVITLMLPVFKTMTTASNTAVKYLRLLLNYAQTTIAEYQQQQKNKNADETANQAEKQADDKQQEATAATATA